MYSNVEARAQVEVKHSPLHADICPTAPLNIAPLNTAPLTTAPLTQGEAVLVDGISTVPEQEEPLDPPTARAIVQEPTQLLQLPSAMFSKLLQCVYRCWLIATRFTRFCLLYSPLCRLCCVGCAALVVLRGLCCVGCVVHKQ